LEYFNEIDHLPDSGSDDRVLLQNIAKLTKYLILIHKKISGYELLFLAHENGFDFILMAKEKSRIYFRFAEKASATLPILLLNINTLKIQKGPFLEIFADKSDPDMAKAKSLPSMITRTLK
jgi:hypothetical protein